MDNKPNPLIYVPFAERYPWIKWIKNQSQSPKNNRLSKIPFKQKPGACYYKKTVKYFIQVFKLRFNI
jgi:hypothetical protein